MINLIEKSYRKTEVPEKVPETGKLTEWECGKILDLEKVVKRLLKPSQPVFPMLADCKHLWLN